MVTFIGAAAAMGPTPGMPAYGLTKAATHHLLSSLSAEDGGLPSGSSANALMPQTIDTKSNREAMPDADYSEWVKPEDIAIELRMWTEDASLRPAHGSLVAMSTKDHQTTFTPLPKE